ncbi:FecR family protein [Chitinophaga jiangningensis]|uniref:FecR family protein n=1 Tax=Chitinophaga jiangningensis TaxID=1419482 RepID=A0A1M7AJY5_9BACT|nr:FecR domain-containing protein [Chitinophaga jiangningensis]SHL43080.1 FecR family protein [Chitinophaga jiangningensis]
MEPNYIYELITKKLSAQITPEEDLELSRWLESAENQAEYEALTNIWKGSNNIPAQRQYNAHNAWDKVESRIQPVQPATVKTMRWKYAAAAAILVLLSAAAWWMTDKPNDIREIAANEGRIKDLQLDDLSKVTLRPGAKIRYSKNYQHHKRVVELTGEAYFEVASDPSHPFLVKTPDQSTIEVLGTAFAVETKQEATTVIVTEGRVRLAHPSSQQGVILTSGLKGVSQQGQVVASDNDDLNFLAWKTGTLKFNDTPLVDIVPQLADFYGKEIRIDDSYRDAAAIQKATISFRDQSCEDALHELQLLLGFNYTQEGNTIVISRR